MNVDPERLRAELKRMKELIANDPRVLARFDTDGNGVIDGDEWEAVRQLVIRRLEREAMEADIARQMREQLDEQQAAELARLEADIAAEDTPEAAPTRPPTEETVRERRAPSDAASADANERDWGSLELAFDPRQDRRVRERSVAENIYERDLVGRQMSGSRHASSVRIGGAGTLADRQELVLEQTGGAKQFFGNMFKRQYIVRDSDGDEIGRVGQKQNEMLQDMQLYSIFEHPNITFHVRDHTTDETFFFERTSGLGDNSITAMNARRNTLASTSWTLSFVRRKYEIRVPREGVSYYVQRRFLKPWTYDILDPFEEPIGTMQRGWSGLGFLTMGNLFHIGLDEEVSPAAMWGFLATALLADLDSESGGRRKSALDIFNS